MALEHWEKKIIHEKLMGMEGQKVIPEGSHKYYPDYTKNPEYGRMLDKLRESGYEAFSIWLYNDVDRHAATGLGAWLRATREEQCGLIAEWLKDEEFNRRVSK